MVAVESYRTAYKYTGEVRFCFGCAKIKLLNGNIKERKCKVFDYSKKCVIIINEWSSRTTIEISRGQHLKSVSSYWIVRYRADKGLYGYVWDEDDILQIRMVGNRLNGKLKLCGITKVKYKKLTIMTHILLEY